MTDHDARLRPTVVHLMRHGEVGVVGDRGPHPGDDLAARFTPAGTQRIAQPPPAAGIGEGGRVEREDIGLEGVASLDDATVDDATVDDHLEVAEAGRNRLHRLPIWMARMDAVGTGRRPVAGEAAVAQVRGRGLTTMAGVMTVRERIGRRSLGALLLLVTLLLAGCNGATGSAPGSGLVQTDPGLTRVPPAERHEAPIAEGTDLEGRPLSTADFGDKVVVINVWGSWCAPCRKEAPDLVAAQEQTADIAQFVGINTRDLDRAPALAFDRAFKINYPSIFDPSGAELLKFTDLPPGMIPSTLVIDREGRVAARVIGPITTTSLVQLVTDVSEGR